MNTCDKLPLGIKLWIYLSSIYLSCLPIYILTLIYLQKHLERSINLIWSENKHSIILYLANWWLENLGFFSFRVESFPKYCSKTQILIVKRAYIYLILWFFQLNSQKLYQCKAKCTYIFLFLFIFKMNFKYQKHSLYFSCWSGIKMWATDMWEMV